MYHEFLQLTILPLLDILNNPVTISGFIAAFLIGISMCIWGSRRSIIRVGIITGIVTLIGSLVFVLNPTLDFLWFPFLLVPFLISFIFVSIIGCIIKWIVKKSKEDNA